MKRLLLFIPIVALLGCQKVIDIDVPIQPTKITANTLIDNDVVWTVDVSKSKYILEAAWQFDSVTNAVVKITDETLHTTLDLPHLKNHRYASNQKPIPGHTYTLNVAVDGFETVTSTTRIPDAIAIKEARWDSTDIMITPLNFRTSVALYVTFDDPPGVRNNYEIALFGRYTPMQFPGQPVNTDTTVSYIQIFHDDPEIYSPEGSADGMLMHRFSDVAFDGEEKTIKFMVPTDNYSVHKMILRLANQSGDYSKYADTRWLQFRAQGDPFAQPAAVYTNINGGYGIFAARTFSVKSWDVPKQ
ncbi:MAG TPA: DUF4249 domain-containing protein [Cyclobacteriaceae bacterium]|nr:DUF4249 domain-containing protein [Cyclobacteriaceae bacterium]